LNVLDDAPEMLVVCAEHDLASVNRGPLAMGLLSGKYSAETRLGVDDVRGDSPDWMRYFNRRPARPGLAAQGRRDPRGAHRRRPHAHPGRAGLDPGQARLHGAIPGCRTVAQIEEKRRRTDGPDC